MTRSARRTVRRPASARTRGAVASASLPLALLLSGCAGPVPVATPDLDRDDAGRCDALVAALPDRLAGLERREVEPADAPGAAYGDPPVTLVCGGPMPPGFDEFASCDEVNGVGWYIPPGQVTDPREGEFGEATLGTVGRRPVLALRVPGEHRPEGLAAVLAALAPYVEEHLEQVRPCV